MPEPEPDSDRIITNNASVDSSGTIDLIPGSNENRKKILFICLGNITRSTIAHANTEDKLKKMGRTDIAVDSAGIYAEEGEPMNKNTIKILEKNDIKISDSVKQRQRLTPKLIDEADLLVLMDVNVVYWLDDLYREGKIPEVSHYIFSNELNTKAKALRVDDPLEYIRFSYWEEIYKEISAGTKKVLRYIDAPDPVIGRYIETGKLVRTRPFAAACRPFAAKELGKAWQTASTCLDFPKNDTRVWKSKLIDKPNPELTPLALDLLWNGCELL
jgi:protein-tyrosine-phosphatase